MKDERYWDKVWSKKYEKYNRHHQLIWEAIEPYIKGNIVDIGCGPAVIYEGKKVSLIGVDWSEEALQQAKLHYPWGVYIIGNAGNTGLPPAQFDTVIMLGLLDCFEDWEKILTEAKRLIKKDGKIIATLLDGYNGHKWTEESVKKRYDIELFKHITGNWYLIVL